MNVLREANAAAMVAVLITGSARGAHPAFVFVKQVNCQPGRIVPIRAYQDGTVASVLYFRLAGDGHKITLGRNPVEIDFGNGPTVTEALDPVDSDSYTVRVPLGAKSSLSKVRCTLRWFSDQRPMYWTWKLQPLPSPQELLEPPKRSPWYRAYHTRRGSKAAIELTVQSSAVEQRQPKGTVYVAGYAFEPTQPHPMQRQIVRGREKFIDEPIFADDQDAMHVFVQRYDYLLRAGIIKLSPCRLVSAKGEIYLDVPHEATAQLPALAQVSIPAQEAKLYPIKVGSGRCLAVILSCKVASASKTLSNRIGATFEYAGPDLASYGLSQVQMSIPLHPRSADPTRPGRPVKLGPLPPLSVRFELTVKKEDNTMDATIPIESNPTKR